MIKELRNNDREWLWRNSTESRGVYYTDKNGEGIFFQSDRTGQTKQLVGTCQFKACETASGTRRKLNKIFDDLFEDPRI
jgi:hypothetical protein